MHEDNERLRIFREALPTGLVIALDRCGWSLASPEEEESSVILRAALGQEHLALLLYAGLETFERALLVSGFSRIVLYSGLGREQADAYSVEELTQLAAPYRARIRTLQLRRRCPRGRGKRFLSAIPSPLDPGVEGIDLEPLTPPG